MTNTPLIPTYSPRTYLSYSTLMDFVRCSRRYFYRKCGIVPPDDATALHYGNAMHKAVAIALTSGLDAGIAAFSSLWDDSLADTKRSLAHARLSLAQFISSHQGNRSIYTLLPPPPTVVTTPDVSPFEIPFAIDVGLPIPIAGRLDGWCQHRDTGEYFAYEFKTASRISSGLFDGLELNPQLLTYALVCRTVTSRPIRGVMFEAMLIDPKRTDCMTHPVLIPDHLLDDIVVWLKFWGELLLACESRAITSLPDLLTASRSFPKNFAGCSSYSHFYQPGSHCDYENLCTAAHWPAMLPYYRVVPDHQMIELTTNGKPTSTT